MGVLLLLFSPVTFTAPSDRVSSYNDSRSCRAAYYQLSTYMQYDDNNNGEASRGQTQGEQLLPLSATDYHVLMVLTESDLYGYAIMKAVEEDSAGAASLGIGSLYRVLARLSARGWLKEVATPKGAPTDNRGRTRQYYRLTREGRAVLRQESRRLERVIELARERKLLPEGSG